MESSALQSPASHPADSPDPALPVVRLAGVAVHALRATQAVGHIVDSARRGRGGWVVTPNLDILRRLVHEPGFAQLCDGATLRLADGMPLVWASRLQRTPLPERVAGSDLIWSLSKAAADAALRVFLLGGNPGAADAAAEILRRRFPALVIAGTHCPPVGFESNPDLRRAVDTALNAADPHVVFVALGSPKQEKLIRELRGLFPGIWFLGIGISFSFVSGEVRRAPRWMQRIGLEWSHRLMQEPQRLFRRYLLDGIPFAVRLLVASFLAGLRHGDPTNRETVESSRSSLGDRGP